MPVSDQRFQRSAGTAIAAFTLAQIVFAALVRNGIISKAEADELLQEAIDANRVQGAGPGNHAAAAMLETVRKLMASAEAPARE